MSKKMCAFLSLLFITFCLPLLPAHAAVKAGGACTKAGITTVASSKTYTCIKSGKKLVWNKGRSNSTFSWSGDKQVTSNPLTAVPVSWPIDKAADQNIFLIADKNIRKFQQANTAVPKLTINYGPTTDKKRADEYLFSLYKAANFWNSDWKFDQEIVVALGTSKDYTWMSQYWSNYGLTGSWFDSSELTYTQLGSNCNHGSATFGNSRPFFWGCLPTQGDLNFIGLKKFSAHEYTHLAQYGIMGNLALMQMPTLISEGSADFYGLSLASDEKTINGDWKTYFSRGFISDSSREYLRKASSDQIEDLLIDSFAKGSKIEGHWYYTGAYVTIRMIAAQGHDGFVRFMKSVAETSNAGQSFEKIYGTNFEAFAKIIAPEIQKLSSTIISR